MKLFLGSLALDPSQLITRDDGDVGGSRPGGRITIYPYWEDLFRGFGVGAERHPAYVGFLFLNHTVTSSFDLAGGVDVETTTSAR